MCADGCVFQWGGCRSTSHRPLPSASELPPGSLSQSSAPPSTMKRGARWLGNKAPLFLHFPHYMFKILQVSCASALRSPPACEPQGHAERTSSCWCMAHRAQPITSRGVGRRRYVNRKLLHSCVHINVTFSSPYFSF